MFIRNYAMWKDNIVYGWQGWNCREVRRKIDAAQMPRLAFVALWRILTRKGRVGWTDGGNCSVTTSLQVKHILKDKNNKERRQKIRFNWKWDEGSEFEQRYTAVSASFLQLDVWRSPTWRLDSSLNLKTAMEGMGIVEPLKHMRSHKHAKGNPKIYFV